MFYVFQFADRTMTPSTTLLQKDMGNVLKYLLKSRVDKYPLKRDNIQKYQHLNLDFYKKYDSIALPVQIIKKILLNYHI